MPGARPGISIVMNGDQRVTGSTDERPQNRILIDHVPAFEQPIEAPDVSGVLEDQIPEYTHIHDVVVDQIIQPVWRSTQAFTVPLESSSGIIFITNAPTNP
jgi:hypothetical protein